MAHSVLQWDLKQAPSSKVCKFSRRLTSDHSTAADGHSSTVVFNHLRSFLRVEWERQAQLKQEPSAGQPPAFTARQFWPVGFPIAP